MPRTSGAERPTRPLGWAGLGAGLSLLLALVLAVVPLLLPPPAGDSAEVRFLRMMLPHHAQAVEMIKRAGPRLRDPEVRRLARTIRAVQERKIVQMRELLRAWNHSWQAPPLSAAHAAAMGMATPADLDRLGTLPSTEAEILFLQLMRRHHEGAVSMSRPLLGWRTRPQVRELARHVEQVQKTEIQAIDRRLKIRGAQALPMPPPSSHEH